MHASHKLFVHTYKSIVGNNDSSSSLIPTSSPSHGLATQVKGDEAAALTFGWTCQSRGHTTKNRNDTWTGRRLFATVIVG